MFRCSRTIFRELNYLCLLKVHFVKIVSMVHRCMIKSVVMWLHVLVGPCWCVYVALF